MEEQALEVRELSRGKSQQAGIVVQDGTGRPLVPCESICSRFIRPSVTPITAEINGSD